MRDITSILRRLKEESDRRVIVTISNLSQSFQYVMIAVNALA